MDGGSGSGDGSDSGSGGGRTDGGRVRSGARLGTLHRLALVTFRRLPRRLRVAAVRLIAPSHTVGAVAVVEHDGRILVLRQHHRPGWTLPGGLVNRGESGDAAVVRELREEVGLDVEVDLPVGVVVEPRSRRVDVVFHVTAHEPVEVRAGSEAIEAAWLRLDELGEIDEPTQTVLDVYRRWRSGRAHSGRVVP